MGSEFVSPREAAVHLGVTYRTILNYLKKGALRKVRQGGRVLIPTEDLEALSIDLGNNFPPLNKKTLFRLLAQVQRLERDVLVLKRMNAIVDAPLRPAPDEALGFLHAAENALKAPMWKYEEMMLWADLFDRMDEIFFDSLEAQNIEEPWTPFYQLCIAQMKQISAAETFDRNLDLQHLHKRLAEGAKLLRRVILAWVELGNGKNAGEALVKLDSSAAILRRIGAKDDLQTG
jgi:excisionase family DNA binding protein